MPSSEKIHRHEFLEICLEEIRFYGLNAQTYEHILAREDVDPAMFHGLFSNFERDFPVIFSEMLDELMMETLEKDNVHNMRVRDRIEHAVWLRLSLLEPYKTEVQSCAASWGVKSPESLGGSIWKTADLIWVWAGDTATDYNHYTKRGLLSGVMASTLLYWLNDYSEDHERTKAFLNRRIENVLFLGGLFGKILKPLSKTNDTKAKNA